VLEVVSGQEEEAVWVVEVGFVGVEDHRQEEEAVFGTEGTKRSRTKRSSEEEAVCGTEEATKRDPTKRWRIRLRVVEVGSAVAEDDRKEEEEEVACGTERATKQDGTKHRQIKLRVVEVASGGTNGATKRVRVVRVGSVGVEEDGQEMEATACGTEETTRSRTKRRSRIKLRLVS